MNTPTQTIDMGCHRWDDGIMTDSPNTHNGASSPDDAETTTYDVIDGMRPLSERMHTVLTMHDAGMPNVAIADALGIAAGTVSNALNDALRRTGRRTDATGIDAMDIDTFIAHRRDAIQRDIDTHVAAIDALRDEYNRIDAIGALGNGA